MKKKLLYAAALCAALSINAAPIPRLLPPVAFAQSVETYEDASLRFLPLTVRTRYFSDGDEEGELLRSHYTTVDFVGGTGAFGNVAKALAAFSSAEKRDSGIARSQLTAEAAMDRGERRAGGSTFFGPYSRERDLYVQRADSLVVSLLDFDSSYHGGVHGMYGASGVNFDARTGRKLVLSDVFTDLKALAEAVKAQLGYDYPDALFMKSGGTGMRETVDQMMEDTSVLWVMEPRGVSFFFNPYVIGSYAEGIYTTTILFDTYPDLFRKDAQSAALLYRGPKAYALELPGYLPLRLSNSPRDDRIRVTGGKSGITILYGGEEMRDPFPVEDIRATFVSCSDGRRYLYADCLKPEGEYVTRVYDLNGSEVVCIGTQPQTRLMTAPGDTGERGWYALTDPNDFYMTATEGGGFAPGTKLRCRVGSDGRIEVIGAEGSVG